MQLPILGQEILDSSLGDSNKDRGLRVQRNETLRDIRSGDQYWNAWARAIRGPLTDPHFYRSLPKILRSWLTDRADRGDGSGKVKPLAISVDVTNKCNLRCNGCYFFDGFDWRGYGELSIDQWRDRLEDVTTKFPILHATYVGGEPL